MEESFEKHDTDAAQQLLSLSYSLCQAQSRDGSWNAFLLRPGGSSLWTSAAALTALGSMGLVLNKCPAWHRRAITRGWHFIETHALGLPIGFNPITPCDADSTCWLARALLYRINTYDQTIQCISQEALKTWLDRCLLYLDTHIDEAKRGVRTYILDDQILEFVGRCNQQSSWLNTHDCVTANVIALTSEIKEIMANQDSNPRLELLKLKDDASAFWWTDSTILSILLDSAVFGETEQKRTKEQRWVLRVPNHEDETGNKTTYRYENDTECGLSVDNGIFSNILKIIQLVRAEKHL